LILENGDNSKVFVEFDPPVTGFFTYYNHHLNCGTIMEVFDSTGLLIAAHVT
jgi:hypothetical protein